MPGLVVELSYARDANFAGHALYPREMKCWLRRSVAGRLALAARTLAADGLRLVAWDCTRTPAAQEALWKAYPHPGSVADPARGSLHLRGVAVDVGLVDRDGKPVPLPTAHDAFGPAAAADAPIADPAARRNRDRLAHAMYGAGFRVNPKEWWHYSRLWGFRWPKATVGQPGND